MSPLLKLAVSSLGVVIGLSGCGSKDNKLQVTGIEPNRGDVRGGTLVTIKGSRFIDDGARNVKVYFGSSPGSVVRFANDRELRVEAPGGKPNEAVDVLVVFEPGGEVKLPKAFTFVEKNTGPTVDDLNINQGAKK